MSPSSSLTTAILDSPVCPTNKELLPTPHEWHTQSRPSPKKHPRKCNGPCSSNLLVELQMRHGAWQHKL
eukprot:4099124-Amphidinium_carterae.1